MGSVFTGGWHSAEGQSNGRPAQQPVPCHHLVGVEAALLFNILAVRCKLHQHLKLGKALIYGKTSSPLGRGTRLLHCCCFCPHCR